MKSLGLHEAAFLERIWEAAKRNSREGFLDSFSYHPNIQSVMDSVITVAEIAMEDKYRDFRISSTPSDILMKELGNIVDDIVARFDNFGCAILGGLIITMPNGDKASVASISNLLSYGETLEFQRDGGDTGVGVMWLGYLIQSSLDVCTSLNLLREIKDMRSISLPFVKKAQFSFDGHQLTSLGVEFLTAVHPLEKSPWVPVETKRAK